MFEIMASLDGSAGGILAAASILNLVINPSVKLFMSSGKLPVFHHLNAGGKCTSNFYIL